MSKSFTISDLGENKLLKEIRKKSLGISADELLLQDDCAALFQESEDVYQLLKTDAICEGVHFLAEEAAERVGKKAVSRVISDIAAMGGRPESYLVTIALPGETELKWVENLYEGMQSRMEEFGGRLVGGETVSVPRGTAKMISVSAVGRVPKDHLKARSGGQLGDLICVTGRLGGSIQGKHLDFLPRLEEGVWLGQQEAVSAMMDLSDGLAADLPRLTACSARGYLLDRDQIPLTEGVDLNAALGDGEDYELLFTLSKERRDEFVQQWEERFPALSLTVIGSLVKEGEGDQLEGGWEHFTSS